MASGVNASCCNIDRVQIDGLVVMKIVKHCEMDRKTSGGEVSRGYLTGMVVEEDRRLEITNCFPTPKVNEDEDDPSRTTEETTEMLRRFRNMNIDYQLLGFYQSASYGACFAENLLESMHEYQSSTEDSIVLVYDPVKTNQGVLSIKAFRLSAAGLERCYQDFSPEVVKSAGLTYETMFVELPIVIKNSHLINVMLCELALLQKPHKTHPYLELGGGMNMSKCVRSLMASIENLNQEIGRYNKYTANKQKQEAHIEMLMQKRILDNEARKAKGEPLLSLDEIKRSVKPPVPPTMLDSMLAASEVSAYIDHTLQTSQFNLGKLFLAQAVIDDKATKERTSSIGNP